MHNTGPLDGRRLVRRNVLIVDGDARAGTALQRFLETEGWTVRHVRDGRAALQLWPALTPNILITDCEGLEVDSFELVALARRTKERPLCVLLTRQAEARVLQPEMLQRLGFAAVIRRPCPFETIAAELELLRRQASLPARVGAPTLAAVPELASC
jgi:DNA-binding response OmpR family regulator